MNLRKVAASFETTEFDAWDESNELFVAKSLTGKIRSVDRFLSNFNRPTKRRLLGLSPSATIPASNTIRDPSTGEIYFIGELRQDSEQGVAYDQVGVLHKTTAIATISRKAPIGPGNDPGVLVASQIGKHYADVELRSASETEEQENDFEGNYFLMMPPHVDLEEWDEVTFDSEAYMIKTPYFDSGFRFARAVKREDPRKDFTYYFRDTGVAYNTATRVVTEGFTTYSVTGFSLEFELDDLNYTPLKVGRQKIVIKQSHIGIVPSAEDELLWEGQRYKVKGVSQDFLNAQYQLDCTL